MARKWKILPLILAMSMLLSGCGLLTLDELYCLPKRSGDYDNIQSVIDKAVKNLSYSAPISGQNRQAVQTADLDGDGVTEYVLFAQDESENPLKILIFCQVASGYVLMDTIEGYGSAFDFVEYAQMDDRDGLEIIVGRRVSDDVARAVSVYRFTSGFSHHLFSSGYVQLALNDLNQDGLSELLLFHAGASDRHNASAVLYGFADGEIRRQSSVTLSSTVANLYQAEVGVLEDGRSTVYVTSLEGETNLVVDILIPEEEKLVNLTKGVFIPAVQNQLVYPMDIDGDGVLELAQTVALTPAQENGAVEYVLQWYSLDTRGKRHVKQYTYHEYTDGWYMCLKPEWIESLRIERTDGQCIWYMHDEDTGNLSQVLVFSVLTGLDREEQAQKPGRFIIHKGERVIYIVDMKPDALRYNMSAAYLNDHLHPIRTEWNNEDRGGKV